MKPSPSSIRGATPLTKLPTRGPDPLACCNICGVAVDPADLPLTVWREHDERDRAIGGVDALVFLGAGTTHKKCLRVLEEHPRLYAEVSATPGYFPELCGPCVRRNGLACTHPELRANGGPGLKVGLDAMAAVVCVKSKGFSGRPVHHALTCAGRELAPAVKP